MNPRSRKAIQDGTVLSTARLLPISQYQNLVCPACKRTLAVRQLSVQQQRT
jgi:hypothetical protein